MTVRSRQTTRWYPPSYCLRRRERGIYLERSTTLSLLEWPVDDPLSNVERP
jgi:hypothetical protein